MNLLKKLWNFLFGKKEEPVVLEETPVEEVQIVNHCESHSRFRKNCPDCLRGATLI
jgi:hypothetical protein